MVLTPCSHMWFYIVLLILQAQASTPPPNCVPSWLSWSIPPLATRTAATPAACAPHRKWRQRGGKCSRTSTQTRSSTTASSHGEQQARMFAPLTCPAGVSLVCQALSEVFQVVVLEPQQHAEPPAEFSLKSLKLSSAGVPLSQ